MASALSPTPPTSSSSSTSDEILRLHNVVASLDEERDRLTAELDAKVSELAAGQHRESTLRDDVSKAESTATFARREVVRLAEAVDNRDRQIQSLKLSVSALRTDASNAQRDAAMFKADLEAATTDLVAMTRENQLVSAEVTSLKADQAAKRDSLASSDAEMHTLRLSVKELESDQASLMAVYQEVCNDYKLLQAELDAAVSLRNNLEEQTASLSSDNGRLRASLAAEEERRDTAERAFAALQESLDHTTRQLAEAYQGSPMTGRTPSELLAEAGGVGEELSRQRAELMAALNQTVHHRNVMLEAQADSDAARGYALAAQSEREAAMEALHQLRMEFAALEDVAKGDRIELADAHVVHAQLREELAVLRRELAVARGTDPVDAVLPPPSSSGKRPPSPLVMQHHGVHGTTATTAGAPAGSASDDRPIAMEASPQAQTRSPAPGDGHDTSPDSAGSATTDAFAALMLENESLKADLRQALARLKEADSALEARGLAHVGAGEVLEQDTDDVSFRRTSAATGLDMVLSPSVRATGGITRGPGTGPGTGTGSGSDGTHTNWATEFQLMEAEFRALRARCESLEKTVRRQADSIQAFQMERQRARRHMLRYESELAAYRRADPARDQTHATPPPPDTTVARPHDHQA